MEFETQRRTASATTKGQRLESAPADWATWNFNRRRRTWATSARRLEPGSDLSERERVEKVRNFLKLNRVNRPITVFFPFKNFGSGGSVYTG